MKIEILGRARLLRTVRSLGVLPVVFVLRLSVLSIVAEAAALVMAPAPGASKAGLPASTHFTPERGFYFAPIDVRIGTDSAGANLVYTMDAANPHPGMAILRPAATSSFASRQQRCCA